MATSNFIHVSNIEKEAYYYLQQLLDDLHTRTVLRKDVSEYKSDKEQTSELTECMKTDLSDTNIWKC